MKHLLLYLLFVAIHANIQAQSLSGTVIDADTQSPLPYANIMIEGQGRGSISNGEGVYSLDIEGLSGEESIVFSYMGYQTSRIKVSQLAPRQNIYLHPVAINLHEVEVYSKEQSAKDIIKKVRERVDENYPDPAYRQRLFTHRYERVPFPEENKITIRRSDFEGMDQSTFDEMYRVMPREFTEYQDAIMDHYYFDEEHKLSPIDGISLEEGAMKDIEKEMEALLGDFAKDIEKSRKDEEVYYKFRTGIFAFDMDDSGSADSSTWKENKNDSLHYIIPTSFVASGIKFLFEDYTRLDSDNWEFVQDPGKYEYEIKNVTYYNEEVVYVISFLPKNRGLYQGTLYVSTSDYGVLQADFSYAPGKDSENIKLLGVAHSMKNKQARVTYEKTENGYLVKYLNVKQKEFASIDRKFSVMKKKKRFLFDKELNEIKMSAHLIFDINSQWEVLVLDRESISESEFEKVQQPQSFRFKKEYSYSPEIWSDRTVLVPTSELQKYTRDE